MMLWWNPKSISAAKSKTNKLDSVVGEGVTYNTILWCLCSDAAMHLVAAVWLYFFTFQFAVGVCLMEGAEMICYWGENQSFSVRYHRLGVKTDATTLCSVNTMCACICVHAGTCEINFFLCVGKAHSHGIIRSNNNSNICDKWQHVHKEQRMKNKAVWRPVLSCLKTDSNFSVCARRCDSQRLVFHGHFVCLCAVMSACISEAARSQSQMKLISIKPFQIRRADGKRTAFKRPCCIPQLADQHEYLSQVS